MAHPRPEELDEQTVLNRRERGRQIIEQMADEAETADTPSENHPICEVNRGTVTYGNLAWMLSVNHDPRYTLDMARCLTHGGDPEKTLESQDQITVVGKGTYTLNEHLGRHGLNETKIRDLCEDDIYWSTNHPDAVYDQIQALSEGTIKAIEACF